MNYYLHFWQADREGPGWLRVETVQKYLNRIYPTAVKVTANNYQAGNLPCDSGGAYSPPYQGGVGGGHA